MKRKISAPSDLSEESLQLWEILTTQYHIEDPGGQAILITALRAHDRARQAQALIQADGLVLVDRWNQKKIHPAAAVERDARSQFLMALKALGLDIEGSLGGADLPLNVRSGNGSGHPELPFPSRG